ncbi:MarR family winged helix-turn-helix transcriptional regulator [Streptomyces sp. NBC_00878]|uniref:MarR family winged helix-turn-helix transcriptional regulator n=1 Tax=Streptomyces sp. NBC_00878 TaxID=2975854 RepID=UPI00224DC018|nr:MarR family transcriptional regulator [Streptomyces sp. NBC_00878]MCX4905897.1 MarR family transcriptional regulator [Streptomyces sp. NBC_00878]
MADAIDIIRAQWAAAEPDVDTSPAEVVVRVLRIARILQRRSDEELERLGVTRAEFDIISLLFRAGRPVSPTEISDQLWTSGAGTTKRLHKLTDTGLVVRVPNPEDGRSTLVQATDAARERLLPILHELTRFEGEILDRLGDSRDSVIGALRTLLAAVDDDHDRLTGQPLLPTGRPT